MAEVPWARHDTAFTRAFEDVVVHDAVRANKTSAAKRYGLTWRAVEPVVLAPKESLAIMNGTTMMAAIGCEVYARAERLARFACALTAMASDVMQGNPAHFDDRIFELKPHPGMRQAAQWIRHDIGDEPVRPAAFRIQDRYSVRCAPHVIGVLLDALPGFNDIIEVEINGASDNPLIDPDHEQVLHGGNFYGGHICFVLDSLKTLIASIADLLERQLVLMCQPSTSNGLPVNLVALTGEQASASHGFKAMQITASALTAEALKLSMPASSFSRSTENHNQDKVSMGSLAGMDALACLDLVETVATVHLLASAQAVDIRGLDAVGSRTAAMYAATRQQVAPLEADRRQDIDIDVLLNEYRRGVLPIGLEEPGGS